MKISAMMDRIARVFRHDEADSAARKEQGSPVEPEASPPAPPEHIPLVDPDGVEILEPDFDTDEYVDISQLKLNGEWEDPVEDHIHLLNTQVAGWTGASVHDLPQDAEVLDRFTYVLDAPNLQETVPAQYRGEIYEADREPSNAHHAIFNSEAGERSSMQILAIDKAGNALVLENTVLLHEDAEGPRFNTMPMQEAFNLADNYRASHEMAKQFVPYGQLPSGYTYPTPSESMVAPVASAATISAFEERPAEAKTLPGQQYTGVLESIVGSKVIQRLEDGARISHDISRIAGAELSSLVGTRVDIRYPYGQVGVIHAAEGSTNPDLQRTDASRQNEGFSDLEK
ncbi:Uncharacterised protein [Bordetella ansorpii]|uniref:Uncharacterized protein n=1 Tax=Bordetella ansorpii TaxID=288768 RepID=A0A157SRU8_9BORD|nr:hypothetical protein [Bordetella ansorpii]SAI73157.1 Uncharacterised protein [Bordetella ansorpii]